MVDKIFITFLSNSITGYSFLSNTHPYSDEKIAWIIFVASLHKLILMFRQYITDFVYYGFDSNVQERSVLYDQYPGLLSPMVVLNIVSDFLTASFCCIPIMLSTNFMSKS